MKFSSLLWSAAMLSSTAFAQDGSLQEFNRTVESADKAREHDKSPNSDRHYKPIIEGLISSDTAIRKRAQELMLPFLTKGWIAVDQFEAIGWEKFDSIGKGMYLWCAATRRTWDHEALGRPLKYKVTVRLWKMAVEEPVALPYLKETAVTWWSLRSGEWSPIRLGDELSKNDRKKLAEQYLAVLSGCTTDGERAAVTWMIVDLLAPEDSTLEDWYGVQASPATRSTLSESLTRILRQQNTDTLAEERDIMKRSEEALNKRLPALKTLAKVASKDWDGNTAAKAKELLATLGAMSAKF